MSARLTQNISMLKRIFSANIELVFDACIKPEHLSQWYQFDEFKVADVKIDLDCKRTYQIKLNSIDEKIVKHCGEFLEISRPYRIQTTWQRIKRCKVNNNPQKNILLTLNLMAIGRTKTELNLLVKNSSVLNDSLVLSECSKLLDQLASYLDGV